jgi:hypothetical protein
MEQGFQIVIAINVALAIFVITLAFYSGMLVQRVKTLEDWRAEITKEMASWRSELHGDFNSLKELIQQS